MSSSNAMRSALPRWLGAAFLVLLTAGPLTLVLLAGHFEGGAGRSTGAAVLASGPGALRLRSADGAEFELAQKPVRVVPTNAAVVDFVTQLVEPERIVLLPEAAFSFSRLAEDPGPWSVLPRFEGFRAEILLGADADLVIATGWQSLETTAALRRAGVAVLTLDLPESWDDVLTTLELLAATLGEAERGRTLAAALAPRVERLAHNPARGLTALSYTNLGTGGWVAGAGTTTDILFELVGLENAAAQTGFSGHRALELEELIALQPDVIVVGAPDERQGIGSTLAYLERQGELAQLPALRRGLVVSLPQELFTTASTELLTAAERLAEELRIRLESE